MIRLLLMVVLLAGCVRQAPETAKADPTGPYTLVVPELPAGHAETREDVRHRVSAQLDQIPVCLLRPGGKSVVVGIIPDTEVFGAWYREAGCCEQRRLPFNAEDFGAWGLIEIALLNSQMTADRVFQRKKCASQENLERGGYGKGAGAVVHELGHHWAAYNSDRYREFISIAFTDKLKEWGGWTFDPPSSTANLRAKAVGLGYDWTSAWRSEEMIQEYGISRKGDWTAEDYEQFCAVDLYVTSAYNTIGLPSRYPNDRRGEDPSEYFAIAIEMYYAQPERLCEYYTDPELAWLHEHLGGCLSQLETLSGERPACWPS